MLEFCPMCKGLLMLKEEKGKQIGFCKCGFKRTGGISVLGEEDSIKTNFGSGIVTEENILSEGFNRVCEKCGHDKAEASQITSNESEITLFKCLRCGNTTRQASGSSKA